MSEVDINKDEVCTNFSKIYWHDSKLIDLHVLKRAEKASYDLQLDLDLIVKLSQGNVDRSKHTAIFRDCRIIQTQLDLLGITLCGGDIWCAWCYTDAVELENERRKMARGFDLPEDRNPLERCLGFVIQMIPPGGEMLIFAKDFELRKAGSQGKD